MPTFPRSQRIVSRVVPLTVELKSVGLITLPCGVLFETVIYVNNILWSCTCKSVIRQKERTKQNLFRLISIQSRLNSRRRTFRIAFSNRTRGYMVDRDILKPFRVSGIIPSIWRNHCDPEFTILSATLHKQDVKAIGRYEPTEDGSSPCFRMGITTQFFQLEGNIWVI